MPYDAFKITGCIDLDQNFTYNTSFYIVNNIDSLSNYAFTTGSNISAVNPNVDYPVYISFDSAYTPITSNAIAADWSAFPATNTVNMNNNEIINVYQSANPYSGATNLIARRVYFDNPADYTLGTSPYRNVLTTSPGTPITFIYPTAFYTYLNCTISFRCDGAKDDLAYYLALSNITATTNLTGEIFNDLYPYIENENKILTNNHSITFQEQFNITTWTNGDSIVPMLFVVTGTGAHTLSNMKFSMVYEPLLP